MLRIAPLCLLAILAGIPNSTRAIALEPFGRLSVQEVADRLGKPNQFVFDANSEKTFQESHIPGATFVHYREYPENVLPKNKDASLIFYCKNPH